MNQNSEIVDYKTKFLDCEDKFDTIFRLTSAASKIISSDLTILKVNDALTAMLGYAAKEIEGTKILDYACEEYKVHWHDLQDALWNREVPHFKLQVCLKRKDHTLAWVDVTTVLFKDSGTTYGFTVLDDITGQKNYEQTQQRLTAALDNARISVWEMDYDLNYVYRSDNHDFIFGYPQPQQTLSIADYSDHLFDDCRDNFGIAIKKLTTSGECSFEGRITCTNGAVKWIAFRGKKEQDAATNRFKFLGTLSDITDTKVKEQYKEDFVSIASHELKTPVTSLKASLQLLSRLMDTQEEPVRRLLGQSNTSILKITALIDDLLNASRAYEHRIQLKKSHFDLGRLIEDCSYPFELSGQLKVCFSGNEAHQVFADAERIERVITGMLHNCVKYATNSNSVTITLERAGSVVRVSVADQGPGIPEDLQNQIFSKDFRREIHQGLSPGFGIGLYTSKEIIERHRGHMGHLGKNNGGSIFWFTLPL